MELQHASVRRASDLTDERAGLGVDRMLPVLPELRELLPGHGLRRGSTVAVAPAGAPGCGGATSLLLALLSAASSAGSWCAVVGLPTLGLAAAAEMGIALDRLALVPHPGPQWTTVTGALLDGFDVVVAAPTGPVAASVRQQLAARARQRGSVLMPFGDWDGADVVLTPVAGAWLGLGRGHGRLRCRELSITARGKGAAARPRRVTMWLPAVSGPLGVAAASAPLGVAAVSGPAGAPDSAGPDCLPAPPGRTPRHEGRTRGHLRSVPLGQAS
ncbi:hypothetical protein [Catellatospora bangladeshensis]|uniref:Uncharacterized protein n=1 Tax=Catellatospora bangladeshensis TaxID=310355 RepID=A0A8J3JI15_9ACTN|nr:hypothetical protein [Catellatospora bangladeshensis]GIF79008.1 hypothetical protein Cba03nite_03570 [Catellatospora bangladeshensis]